MNSIIPTTPESMKQIAQTDEQLINFSRAALEHTQTQLVESEHINEIIDNKAKLAAINEYIKRIDNSSKAKREAMNNLTESITRLERRLGQLIQQKRKSGELVKRGITTAYSNANSLADIGITQSVSANAQVIAALPDDTFEAVIHEGRRSDRGLSQTFVREKGREHKRKGKLGQLKADARLYGIDIGSASDSSETLSAIKTIYDDYAAKIAMQTREWAIQNGCFRKENGVIGGYFIIKPSESKSNSKPIWSVQFEELPEEWSDIRDKMVELKIPIARDALNGWYIGHRGEQMTIVNTTFNYTHTHAQTALKVLELIHMTEELPYTEEYFTLKEGLNDLTIEDLYIRLFKFVNGDEED